MGSNSGGAVNLKNASLLIEGGAIRNCSASNGGAVYKDGSIGTVTMIGGSITHCTATTNGGGICIQSGPAVASGDSFTMTGGSITRCTASKGGGVWMTYSHSMSMSGGNISQNSATTAGGGIAVGGNGARLNFSGAAFVYNNTCSASVASSKASNVQMDQGFSVSANNPGTIIHTTGLIRGATIGVYVPDAQYDAHGDVTDPFGTYEGTPAGFNYFINDRNGLKGGLMEGQAVGTDMKVYWRQIYTLEVNLEVLSRAASDKEMDFHFTVTLDGTVGGKQWNEVNETYGDMEFHGGVATFTLNGSTHTTAMADLLPLGYGYTVTMTAADATGFTVYPSLTQTGTMNEPSQFLYTVNFRVVRDVVCKITDKTYGLLYYKRGEAYAEAVYDALVSAFNRVNMGELYYKVGDSYIPYTSNNHRIEMLIPNYEMTEPTALNAGKTVLLTTADPNADDGFPYAGGSSTAVIRRGYDGASMITVNGNLTAGNITLDGNSAGNHSSTADGGILKVASGASLTVGTGAALQNSTTSGSGAAIYLAEGSKMYISGGPVFSENKATGLDLGNEPKNGADAAVYTDNTTGPQDIYIAGYDSADAASLVVTGDITSGPASIWVWAEASRHYVQSKQFAVMESGIHNGLGAFRNAQTDTATRNPLKKAPWYLYGVRRGNSANVYWSGSVDLAVTKTVTGDFADPTRAFNFTVHVADLAQGDACDATYYTTNDGTNWTQVSTSTLTADANHDLTFQLSHHQRIVISIPAGCEVTVTETTGVDYVPSYAIGSGAATQNNIASFTINDDTTVAFTNQMNAPSPSGVVFHTVPFVLMLAVGLLLPAVTLRRQRRKKEE